MLKARLIHAKTFHRLEGLFMLTYRNYEIPADLETAWKLNQKKSNVLIGGMHWLKLGSRQAQTAIDLSGLGLDKITETESEFNIGCMTTLRQLETHGGLISYTQGAIKEALKHIVGVQFRNTATIGGSVAGRFGFSDVITLLLALEAKVTLYKGGVMAAEDYIYSPRDNDIIVNIIIPKKEIRCCYQSVRNSQTDFPVITCAAVRTPDEWIFSIGARPGIAMRFTYKISSTAGDYAGDMDHADLICRDLMSKIPTGSNLRCSSRYRTHLIGVLTDRAIKRLEV
jgi:CO/xanthine dehydrogenase FAD-binding subunit